ncbi:MAG: hypothetical protein COA32_17065 [Fluviicola sp.]|nr:MAG: hypothetical protein COA32_17065 [Fluviicola sp.]
MSGKRRLGKTKDSRTRKQVVKAVNVTEAESLREELKNQAGFTDYLLTKGFSITSIRRYVRDINNFILWLDTENMQVEQVSYNDILHFIQEKKNTVKQRTLSAMVNSMKHFYTHLISIDQLEDNPALHVKIKGVKRRMLYQILSKKELESLYHNFELPENEKHVFKNQNWFKASELAGKRNKVILGFMIYQGMGTSELSNLTEKDIKLREGKVYIAGSRRSNERTLKLEATQIMDIMEYQLQTRKELLELTGKQTESYFVTTGSSDRVHNMLTKLIENIHKKNSKVTSIKQIRTSVITHWLKRFNLRQAQYMAGHRYVSTTEGYLVNDLDDLSEEITKFHPMG